MKKSCFIHLSLLCNLLLWLNDAIATDAIYRYVDERGVINFTDRPPGQTQPSKKSAKASYDQMVASVRIYKFIDNDGTVHLADRQLDVLMAMARCNRWQGAVIPRWR